MAGLLDPEDEAYLASLQRRQAPAARPIRARNLDGLLAPDAGPSGVAPWSGLPPTPGYTEARVAAPLRADDFQGFLGQTRDVLRGTPGASGYEPSRVTQLVADSAAGPAGTVGGARGIRAFHGSPHDFDRFRMDRIGTGEGAQAYGHGLYFAEKEGVARGYRDALSSEAAFHAVDNFLRRNRGINLRPEEVVQTLKGTAAEPLGNDPSVVDALRRLLPNYTPNAPVLNDELTYYRIINDAAERLIPGRMYEVNLNVDPNRLLDWDAPLREQRNVAGLLGFNTRTIDDINAAAEKLFEEGNSRAGRAGGWMEYPDLRARYDALNRELDALAPNEPGGAFYRGLDSDSAAAAARLRDAGVPGVRYLDAGSRSAGEGTRNYVMFDDALIEILRKYGLVPGMVGGGGAAGILGGAEGASEQ